MNVWYSTIIINYSCFSVSPLSVELNKMFIIFSRIILFYSILLFFILYLLLFYYIFCCFILHHIILFYITLCYIILFYIAQLKVTAGSSPGVKSHMIIKCDYFSFDRWTFNRAAEKLDKHLIYCVSIIHYFLLWSCFHAYDSLVRFCWIIEISAHKNSKTSMITWSLTSVF